MISTNIVTATRALFNSLTDASVYKPYNWPFKRIFVVKSIRELGPRQEAPYGQSLSPTTGDAVRVACEQQKWPLQSQLLSPGASYADATLHEIKIESSSSPPSRKRALLFFHGGGYRAAMARAGHMLACHSYAKTLEASHLIVLEYSLSPGQTYPTQLAQAISSLAKLIVDFDFKPEEIVLAGDSAGGTLVFALLAHLIQPHPGCSVIPQMQGKQLKAALCISPWVTMKYNSASCQENEEIDMLTKERMELFTKSFKPSEGHVWADMLTGDMSLWSQIPVKHILLTAGALEILGKMWLLWTQD
ncbi:Putative alpha/beta hydrolase-3, lipase, GDXG serine active [Septoria linicola]|uniref:Alpha/beta hydrolase-3, lipase, GDXG serine active n=1 Tax=Septoria linicola TaxID=215465 RepID=A0A9Q9ARK0_9PEZI|nr:putative alpha/beta hydrolase-3, lipase, GDXG serine active [Septoria linicola]USW54442.1 Putative alpha/beta hydrolase-3, lipase, GDXG serine active [Septoria linicola]